MVPRAGYELKTITAHGLSKKVTINNFKNILETIQGINQAKAILQEFKPNVVIGTGGYICGPVFLAAKKLKIPTVLHESNAFPGMAVKALASKTNTILVGFEDAKKRLNKAKKVVVTGTPTKIQHMNLTLENKEELLEKNGFKKDLPLILVFGGSQGAKAINDSLIGIIVNKLNENYQVMWATGPKQYEIIREELARKGKNINNIYNMKIVPYIYNMEEILNVSDLVIARSGAMTITEIAKIGKPAIFIPLPNVSQNHQEYNAKVLANIGAAEIIQNDSLNESILSSAINKIISHKERMRSMGEAAKTIDVSNVEDRIYDEILKVL